MILSNSEHNDWRDKFDRKEKTLANVDKYDCDHKDSKLR